MRKFILILTCGLLLAALALDCPPVWGQRIRLPQPPGLSQYDEVGETTTLSPPVGSGLTPITPYPGAYGGSSSATGAARLGQPSFDPYASSPEAAHPPMMGPPAGSMPPQPGFGDVPAAGFPSGSPPVLFPDGLSGPGAIGAPQFGPPIRLVQNVRLQHTWLAGGDRGHDLQIHDSEVSATLAYPNFLFSTQPLFISPVFILHLWDGPSSPVDADLPSKAYSAFLDVAWKSDPTRQFGAEVNANIGVYTDFDTISRDSIRIRGMGLGTFRITPTLTAKAGVEYLDRNRIKLLPAGGLLWEPNPQTRFDIFFPRPKLAQYLTTLGTTDLWWYLGGEYGGGAWTIRRPDGRTDQIDINDLRAYAGLEWFTQGGLQGMVEVGYVWDREVLYRVEPDDNFRPRDTVMLRGGLQF